MPPAAELLLTHALTGTATAVGAWAVLRGKRMETAGDERVATINAGPTFAAQLLEALDRLDAERQLVAQLRVDLAAVTSERDVLAVHVDALSARLDETTARLGELNEQFTALARNVHAAQIPEQRTP